MQNRIEELLTILQEEAAEIIQAVSKIRRFGEESQTNKADLVTEVGDLLGVLKALVDDAYIDEDEMLSAADAKVIKMEKYMTFKKEPS